MRGDVIRHEGHQEAVHRVINAVRFDAERRMRLSKSEGERILGVLGSALDYFAVAYCNDKVMGDILTDRIRDSWRDWEGWYLTIELCRCWGA